MNYGPDSFKTIDIRYTRATTNNYFPLFGLYNRMSANTEKHYHTFPESKVTSLSCFVWPTLQNPKTFSLQWYKTE